MIIFINIIATSLFVFIIWWFWLSSPKVYKLGTEKSDAKKLDLEKSDSETIDVIVDNGVYTPSHIEVNQGQALTLRFLRKDASLCAEKVIFEDWNLSADLPVERTVELKVPTDEKGEHAFTCQMQMYRGVLNIK